MKTAIILGATGLTGGLLLKRLLADSNYSEIKLFSRTASETKHPKIKEHIIDLFKLEDYATEFTADVVFCCVGTTKSKTPSKKKYRKVDFGIPVEAAKLCKRNHIDTFIVISAMGANPDSKIFYNRTKGEMEQEVLQQKIENTYILQPSLIVGDRKESRLGEKFATIILKMVNLAISEKYRPILAEIIAKAMQKLAKGGYPDSKIPSDKIKHIAFHA